MKGTDMHTLERVSCCADENRRSACSIVLDAGDDFGCIEGVVCEDALCFRQCEGGRCGCQRRESHRLMHIGASTSSEAPS